MSYAGDVSCEECWKALHETEGAQLVDVRTSAEWSFVGLPDLGSVGKRVITIEWQKFPGMDVNTDFVEVAQQAIEAAGGDKDAPIFCLCRSGARSISAAVALTNAGFSKAYNVLGGFEGDKNQQGHRGKVSGWKHDGLPWQQG